MDCDVISGLLGGDKKPLVSRVKDGLPSGRKEKEEAGERAGGEDADEDGAVTRRCVAGKEERSHEDDVEAADHR